MGCKSKEYYSSPADDSSETDMSKCHMQRHSRWLPNRKLWSEYYVLYRKLICLEALPKIVATDDSFFFFFLAAQDDIPEGHCSQPAKDNVDSLHSCQINTVFIICAILYSGKPDVLSFPPWLPIMLVHSVCASTWPKAHTHWQQLLVPLCHTAEPCYNCCFH